MILRGRFRALYGAGPLQLLVLLASFAIAGAAVVGWFQRPREVVNVLEWFLAAAVIHDLVLLPLYSLLDRIAFGGLAKRVGGGRRAVRPGVVNPTPYLRIPAILSGLLLATFFPVIFGLGEQTELSASGIVESGYLARWLLATGVMFAVSGMAYAVAIARAGAVSESVDLDARPEASGSDLMTPEPEQASPEAEQASPEPERATPELGRIPLEPEQASLALEQASPAPDQTTQEPGPTPPSDVAAPPPAPD